MPNSDKLVTVKIYKVTAPLLESLLKDYQKKKMIVGRAGRGKLVHILAMEECKRRGLKT